MLSCDRVTLRYAPGMGQFPVSPEKEEQLSRRMSALGVSEADLRESFVRSGGHGGQNVNKTSTCVMLTHAPTGLQVKCQSTRQQGVNRFLARNLLLDKIQARRAAATASQRAEFEKQRRRKRRPTYASRQRTLADKSRHSQKKRLRRALDAD